MLPIVVDLDGGIGSQQEEQRPGGGIGSFVKATCYLLNTNPLPLQSWRTQYLWICIFEAKQLDIQDQPLAAFAYHLRLPAL